MDIRGKVAIVTGGAAGIGLAYVQELLKNDAKGVAILDIHIENAEKSVSDLAKEFGDDRVVFIKCDVTNNEEFENAFEKTIDIFGKLDIVINNAGIGNEVNYALAINVNLTGVVRGIYLGLKYMDKSKNGTGGVILNTASTIAFLEQGFLPVYSATKAGVVNVSLCMGHAFHYDRTGVRVIALCPGMTDTQFGNNENTLPGCATPCIDYFAEIHHQQPQNVGRAGIYVIKNGASASIWMIVVGKLSILDPPNWEAHKRVIVENI